MILEEIAYSDKYNLVELNISGEKFLVSYDFYNDLKISIGDEFSFNEYKEIVNENQYNRCKNYALKQISYKMQTSFDLRKKLSSKEFSSDNIEKTIDFLNKFKLINDDYFVKSFINDKSKISLWSKNKIFYSLKSKFIPESLINKHISCLTDEEELIKALKLANKKVKDDFSQENKQKIYRYLAGRAFSYDIISRCLEEIFQ